MILISGTKTASSPALKLTTDHTKRHPLYLVWANMKQRCLNPKHKHFKHYGGRGIGICGAWINNPTVFIEWALKNGYKPGLEIDRRDNDQGYSPLNCHFVTHRENLLNRRGHGAVPFKGVGWHNQRNKYRAYVTINRKYKSLGLFKSALAAAFAYDMYIIDHNLPNSTNILKK
jgi:hypothetical protein